MFHIRALKGRLNLRNKTNKHICMKHDLSHINHRQVSITFAVTIRVTLQEC